MCRGERLVDLVNDSVRCLAWVGIFQDRTTDYKVVRTEANGLGRRRVPFVFVRRHSGRPNTGTDNGHVSREALAAQLDRLTGCDETVAASIESRPGPPKDVLLKRRRVTSYLKEI